MAHPPRRQSLCLDEHFQLATRSVHDGDVRLGKAEIEQCVLGVICFWPREAFCRMRLRQHLHLAAWSLCLRRGSGMMSCPAMLCIMAAKRSRQLLVNVSLEH